MKTFKMASRINVMKSILKYWKYMPGLKISKHSVNIFTLPYPLTISDFQSIPNSENEFTRFT